MKRVFSTLLLLALFTLGLHTGAAAQQTATGQNFNVNPGVADQYVGDKFLQRQVEPKVMCASNNTLLCLGIANDYRTVDMIADSLTGFGEVKLRDLFAPKTRLAAADAWLGLYRMANARNFVNGLVPGFPQDTSPLGKRQPWYGLAAASDGSLATDGVHFYGAGLFFNRGGRSMIGAFRLTAYNDESTLPIRWDDGYSRVIDVSSATSTGLFADLPSIVTDGPRGTAECGNVYMAYTRFSGAPAGNSFIFFSRSSDCGKTYSRPVKISGTYNMTQRVVIAIDPRQGTPTTTGGGTLYGVFRTYQPDQFVFTRSTDYGATWTSPAPITNRSGPNTLCTYDQPTVGTTESSNPNEQTARAMAFASVQVDSAGKIHVVWTERVDPVTGLPLSGRSCTAQQQPKIVYTSSSDRGKTWTTRKAIDMGSRCETKAMVGQAAGLDRSSPGDSSCPLETSEPRTSGPQIQPVLAYNAGALMLLYSEGRENPVTTSFLSSTGYHSGLDTQMDVRAAQIDPGTGALLSTTQVSRYAIDAATNDLKAVDNSDPSKKAYSRPYLLQYKGGTVPFKGDHDDLVPMEKFVWESPPHFAKPGEVPGVRFFGMWGGDNREALFPGGNLYGEWWRYVDPGSGGPSPCNAGIRNSNNYAAYIGSPIEAFVHQSFKPPFTFSGGNKRRTWVITVRNHSDTPRILKYKLQEALNAGNASFDQFDDVDIIGNQADNPFCSSQAYPECTAYRTIQPYSSMTFTVFGEIADPTVPAPFKINVYERASGVDTVLPIAIVRLNPNPTNPVPLVGTLIGTQERHGPSVQGPFVSTHGNPTQGNPTQGNPTQGNPTQGNPTQGNAGFGEYTDYRYVVSATDANTISGYSAFASIPTDVDQSHLVQMIITRRHKVPALGPAPGCDPIERIEDEVISTITVSSVSQLSPTQGNPTQGNPTQGNPTQGNPTQGNPTQGNPTQGNNTFALSPQSAPAAGSSASAATYAATAIASAFAQAVSSIQSDIGSDGTLVSTPETDEVHVTFRFFHCTSSVGCSITLPDGSTGSFSGETEATESVPRSCTGEGTGSDLSQCSPDSLASGLMSMTTKTEAGNNIQGEVFPPEEIVTGPDLVVSTEVSVVPSAVVAGDLIQVSGFTVTNQGNADAGPSSYGILAVPDPPNGTSIWLSAGVFLSAVASGPSGSVLVQPSPVSTAALPAGNYLVGPFLDDQNLVGETNEFNNFAGATLTVVPPLTVATVSLTDAVVNTAYSSTLVRAGGISPYQWTISAGRLPPGLSLNPTTGEIQGTPVSSGKTHTFTVQVVDSADHSATRPLTIRVIGASYTRTNTDYAWGASGALFGTGTGTITISGVSATPSLALLYWQGPTTSADPNINATVSFNGITITGTNIGFTQEDCYGSQAGAVFTNCQAYRADVTGLVSAAQTSYALSNFRKANGTAIDAETQGVSLLVFYNDGFGGNNRTVYLFDGADSNQTGSFDGPGWNATMTPVTFTAGSAATLQLHVAGGQAQYSDPALLLNGTEFVATGAIFQGDSVPPYQQGGLWDIKDFDVSSFMTAGTNTLSLTTGAGGNECMSLVVAAVVIQPLTTTDLVVDTLTHYPAIPTDLDLITVTATVRNIGQATAGPSTLELCVGGESPVNCHRPTVPTLAPGGAFTYSREVATLPAQAYVNHATADLFNSVAETNESNNLATPDQYSVVQATGPTLSGTIYYSVNGLSGVQAELVQGMNPPLRRATTNGNGFFEFPLLAAGSYGVVLHGPDASYSSTSYGAVISTANVSVNWDLPKIITGLSPANGEQVSATPTLSWTPNPDATYYLIEVFQMPSFTRVVFEPNVPSASYTVTTALGTGTYQWHVGAYRPGHNVGENSLTPTFVVPLQENFPSITSTAPSQATVAPGAVGGTGHSLKDAKQRRER